jgi:hypothetical protein
MNINDFNNSENWASQQWRQAELGVSNKKMDFDEAITPIFKKLNGEELSTQVTLWSCLSVFLLKVFPVAVSLSPRF